MQKEHLQKEASDAEARARNATSKVNREFELEKAKGFRRIAEELGKPGDDGKLRALELIVRDVTKTSLFPSILLEFY